MTSTYACARCIFHCRRYSTSLIFIIFIGSFVYLQSTSLESRFLELPTYYRLCQMSLAVTLSMTSLEVFPQSNREFYFNAATQDQSLLPWSIVNISIPSYTTTLIQTFRSFKLWFIGTIADDFTTVGEGIDYYHRLGIVTITKFYTFCYINFDISIFVSLIGVESRCTPALSGASRHFIGMIVSDRYGNPVCQNTELPSFLIRFTVLRI